MKKVSSFLILTAIIIASLSSCKKDSESSTEAAVSTFPKVAVQTSYYYESIGAVNTMYYDSRGLLTKITEKDGTYTTFSYSESSISTTYSMANTIVGTSVMTLNSKGYVESVITKGNDGVTISTENYTYDSDGHQISDIYSNSADGSISSSINTWSNGNMVCCVYTFKLDNDTYTANYTYTYTSVTNNLDINGKGNLFGMPNKNLQQTRTWTNNVDSWTRNYIYTYDAQNRVIRQASSDAEYTTYSY